MRGIGESFWEKASSFKTEKAKDHYEFGLSAISDMIINSDRMNNHRYIHETNIQASLQLIALYRESCVIDDRAVMEAANEKV